MQRFRLRSATMAVYAPEGFKGFKGHALIIPAGAEIVSVDPIETRPGFNRTKLIEVGWEGKTVRMFLLDLLERGERLDGGRS
jgi:hypothetical protein